VLSLKQIFDDNSCAISGLAQSEAMKQLDARHKSLMTTKNSDLVIRYRQDVHPCRGGLQLIRGDDRGGIDRCLKKDLTITELERQMRRGTRGIYLFWKCESCQFRIKYFAFQSRVASLLTNNDHLNFKDSTIKCSKAFLTMSHLEQRESNRLSSSYETTRYTCLLCALHRLAAKPGCGHTFFKMII
jgi:hypothetical protein